MSLESHFFFSSIFQLCLYFYVNFRLISKAGAISERKLDEFLGWYPIMQRRSEEGSEIGPDAMAIERQLQEVKVSADNIYQIYLSVPRESLEISRGQAFYQF